MLVAIASAVGAGSLHAQQPTNQTSNQRDPAATTQRTDGTAGHQQQGVPIQQAIVHKLERANEAEIELAKLAIDRSDNQQVQELAKMIMQDHQACNQKLQKMNGQTVDGQGVKATQPGGQNANAGAAVNPPRTNPGVNNLGANNPGLKADPNNQHAMAGGQIVPGQLIQIMDQACDNSLQMTKEMLQKYEGQDFSMAFLGQQCVAHTMMLAELKAIQSQGPEELKSLAGEAAGKIQSHLEKTKQLAKQLEDDRGTTRAANKR